MKKNKILSLLFALTMSLTLFAGCGNLEKNQEAESTAAVKQTEESTTKEEGTQSTEKSYTGQSLSLLVAKSDSDSAAIYACIGAFEEKYSVTVEIEETPTADDGENIIKVRAATNSLPDIIASSVGAKLAELDPAETFVDLSGEAFMEKVDDGYVKAVTINDGVYGVPMSTSNVGGVYYNKKVYETLGLEVPETWEAFMENCATIKSEGIDPVAAPYESTGLSQIPFLTNYYYVQEEYPTFADDYTANKISLAENEVFVRGLQKMYDMADNNYLNEDYLSTSNDIACGMLAEGKAAHMIIRSNILATIAQSYSENINDIGFFPIPDENAEVRGVSKWLPMAYCISQGTKNLELAKLFLGFIVTDEAVEAYCSEQKPSGAFMIKGVNLPDDIYPALIEAQKWVNTASTPVMEYSCPIKGANQASICVQVASGSITAEEAVIEIEKDNKLSAEQMGLENWIN